MNEDKIVVVKELGNDSTIGYLKLDGDVIAENAVVHFHDENLPALTVTSITNGIVTASASGGRTYTEYSYNVRILKSEVDRIMIAIPDTFPRSGKDFVFGGE